MNEVVIKGASALETTMNLPVGAGNIVIDTANTAGPDMNQPSALAQGLEKLTVRAAQLRMIRRAIALAKRQELRKPMKAKRKARNRKANKVARQKRKQNR